MRPINRILLWHLAILNPVIIGMSILSNHLLDLTGKFTKFGPECALATLLAASFLILNWRLLATLVRRNRGTLRRLRMFQRWRQN